MSGHEWIVFLVGMTVAVGILILAVWIPCSISKQKQQSKRQQTAVRTLALLGCLIPILWLVALGYAVVIKPEKE